MHESYQFPSRSKSLETSTQYPSSFNGLLSFFSDSSVHEPPPPLLALVGKADGVVGTTFGPDDEPGRVGIVAGRG